MKKSFIVISILVVSFALIIYLSYRKVYSPEGLFVPEPTPLPSPTPVVTPVIQELNVILISLDTLRADYVGAYGSPLPLSPFLDRLVQDNFQFFNCIVQAPWTLASHMSMLTSQYPNVHKVNMMDARLSDDKLTLQAYLNSFGWTTTGYYSNPFLQGRFGFKKGFDKYIFAGLKHGFEVTSGLVEWIEKADDRIQPFFLFMHYNDPHGPYQAPGKDYNIFNRDYKGSITGTVEDISDYVRKNLSPEDLAQFRLLYSAEVRYLNKELQIVFQKLIDKGLYDEALIIITSDHGEEFKEHGLLEHNQTLYDEILRTPLIIKLPASFRQSSAIIETPVRNIDIMPTILHVLGLPVPKESVQGESLLPLMRQKGKSGYSTDKIFSEAASTYSVSIRTSEFKYIYHRKADEEELFELQNDPGETVNVIKSYPEEASLLGTLARAYISNSRVGWHIRNRSPFDVTGTFLTDGSFKSVEFYSLENDDKIKISDDRKTISFSFNQAYPTDRLDGVDFVVDPSDSALILELEPSDNLPMNEVLKHVFIGKDEKTPLQKPIILNGPERQLDPGTTMNDLLSINRSSRRQEPGIYIWNQDEKTSGVIREELDEVTANQLKSLGYLD